MFAVAHEFTGTNGRPGKPLHGRTLHTSAYEFTSLKIDGYSAQPRSGARNHPWWKDRHGSNDNVAELLPVLL